MWIGVFAEEISPCSRFFLGNYRLSDISIIKPLIVEAAAADNPEELSSHSHPLIVTTIFWISINPCN